MQKCPECQTSKKAALQPFYFVCSSKALHPLPHEAVLPRLQTPSLFCGDSAAFRGGGVVLWSVAVDGHALCVRPGHHLNCLCVFGAGRRGVRLFSRPPRRAPESYRRAAHLISRAAYLISRTADVISRAA